jgi:hypothetical protein
MPIKKGTLRKLPFEMPETSPPAGTASTTNKGAKRCHPDNLRAATAKIPTSSAPTNSSSYPTATIVEKVALPAVSIS